MDRIVNLGRRVRRFSLLLAEIIGRLVAEAER
jgi:hypothetical protein